MRAIALAVVLSLPLVVNPARAQGTCDVTVALVGPISTVAALALDYAGTGGGFPGDSNHPGLGPSWGTTPLHCTVLGAFDEVELYDDNVGVLSSFVADVDGTIPAGPLFSCIFAPVGGFPCPDPSAFTVATASFPSDPFPPPVAMPPPPAVTITVVPRTPVCGDGFAEGGEECDDGNSFADDCCTDACEAVAVGTSCDDHDACTTGGACDAAATCVPVGPVSCDDGIPCTYDHCDATLGCLADSGPSPLCHPAEASIDLRDAADDAKDALTLKMRLFGHAAGDPTATTNYALCVFDESAAVASLAYELTVPAGAPWQAAGASGKFVYVDPAGSHGGVQQVRLLVKSPNKPGKFQLKAKGGNLELPTPFDGTRFFASDPRLTVQLENSDGACWSMVVAGDRTKKNTPTRYQAKH